MTLGDERPEHSPRPRKEAAVLTLTLPLPTCPTRSQGIPRPKGSSTAGRAPRHSPTSSLANLTSRRATYSGSSPPSSMRPSQ